MHTTLSHYRIESEIGRGGMGVVYRATDTRLNRPVAIKVLAPGAAADAERIKRFIQEARSASALTHPGIVTIYEVDEQEATTFIAMELVEGATLDRLLASGPLPVSRALDIAAQIASALEAAHARGIVHRDIKPANVVVCEDGRVKVLDFGLAKLFEPAPTAETVSALATRQGQVLGTPAYMSPEQAEARQVDARSDIFSLGGVLYEMLAGRRAFAGDSDVGIITSILRDRPPLLRSVRPDAPAGLQAIVDRALAKDAAGRYASAGAMRRDLLALQSSLDRPPPSFWKRPAVLAPLAAVLLAVAGLGVWQYVQARRVLWARTEGIPEIERLQAGEQYVEAVRRLRQVERYAPAETVSVRQGWHLPLYNTKPDSVDVEIKNYLDVNGAWEPLGRTPVQAPLPFGFYRVRLTKEGYDPIEISAPAMGRPRFPLVLAPAGSTPPGMVHVAGSRFGFGVIRPVVVPDFWLDRLEVTNRDYKRFVDAGGYREARFWKTPFEEGARVLSFDEATSRFRDTTGRPGPATWELGTFPAGTEEFPVSGISWFEAAAFAEFSAKTLPTVHQFFLAANIEEISADILRLSNFDNRGPRRAGESGALGPWGTIDMAGNVAEWCLNVAEGSSMRFIMGGAWDEPSYRYTEPDARSPWDRSNRHGVRLAKNMGPLGDAVGPVGRVYGDPKSVVPEAPEKVDGYKRFYQYDRSPLDARLDSVDDSSEYWRKESVSFNAAYGGERVPANLFLPKNSRPPYQVVVVFPSAYALYASSSQLLDYSRFDFIMRGGRAALYPVYRGTYERRFQRVPGPNSLRDWYVQMAKDLFRSVDYLQTRQDLDVQNIGYYSLSMGAFFAPVPLALEPRIKAAVIAAGGLRFNSPPEIQPANFAPLVKTPVLMVNGRNDFQAPVDSQQRLFELLGTPPEHKKHVVLDGGHVPNDYRALVREALDWYDKYLGSIR